MAEQQSEKHENRRASDWYIPFSLVATVIGVLVGVNSLLTPLFQAMLEINVKLARLEGQVERLDKLETKVDELEAHEKEQERRR
jgi:hypothetical protein